MSNALNNVKYILEKRVGLKANENVTINTDSQLSALAYIAAQQANEMDANVLVIDNTYEELKYMTPTGNLWNRVKKLPDALPPHLFAAWRNSDVMIYAMNEEFNHFRSHAYEKLIFKGNIEDYRKPGSRSAFLSPYLVDFKIEEEDLKRIRARTDKLAEAYTKAGTVKVVTPAGTNVTFSKDGRQGLVIDFMYFAESATAPLEETVDGRIVIDGAMVGVGIVKEPIKWTVKKGKIVAIRGGKDAEAFKEILARHGESAKQICEFGIATGEKLPPPWDPKAVHHSYSCGGSAHFAVGENARLGGKSRSEVHLDGQMMNPTIWFDGREVCKNGEVKL
jgi:leucyl aminopeptidase (aminopeptidase T)